MKNPKCEIKHKKLDFHPENKMIPQNFDIFPKNEKYSKEPVLIAQWPDTDLWYKKDDESKVPKAIVTMKLYTSDCEFGKTAKGRVFSNLWNTIVQECLREFNSACVCANVYFNNILTMDNIEFECSGYNDSMPDLLAESINRVLKVKDTEDFEEIFK